LSLWERPSIWYHDKNIASTATASDDHCMENTIYASFINWCKENRNIRTVILTSSRAHPDGKCDILSDYDIELYVTDISPCLKDDTWVEQFGSILIRWPSRPATTWSSEWITRLIQFQDGTRFDLQITEKKPAYHPNFDAGYMVLIDKDKIMDTLQKADVTKLFISKPGRKEFEDMVHAFLWDSIYVAKSLWRDELFYAKYMLDSVLRFQYLQVFIEWYIGATNNWKVSTNKYGRWFKQYLKTTIWHKVEKTFAGASIEENWQALYEMMGLTRFLCHTICAKLKFQYPDELEKNVRSYVTKIQSLEKH
jgi:aminoglycoside 6-adenylyltransferase